MLQSGIPLTINETSVFGIVHTVDAELIRYLKRVITFLQPEDLRPEQEKDIWRSWASPSARIRFIRR